MKVQTKERTVEAKQTERTCPNCGMPKSQWKGNYGQGYQQQGETYCCEGCAENVGCGCIPE